MDENGYYTPFYVGALGFATNTDWLENNNMKAPESWEDLLQPGFENNVTVAHPASSGTAYTVLASIVQMMGEEDGFQYMSDLDQNIRQYTTSGSAPGQQAGLNETGVGILFAHDILEPMDEGYPIKMTFPEEGTGYEVGGVAMIDGAPEDQVKNAETFIDWVISKDGQDVFAESGFHRVPVHPEAEVPEGALPMSEVETMDYDAEWAGDNRDALLNQFEEKVEQQPEE